MSDPEWQQVPLEVAAEVTIGRQRSPKNASGPSMVPYLRAANVKDGLLLLTDVLEMNFNSSEQDTYRLVEGDVLVTEGCGSIGELGASAAFHGELEGMICFQNTLLRLRARPGISLPGFIEQWARWAHRSGIWAGVASGTNIFHIGVQRARDVRLLLPPLADQRRIVDLLGAVDRVLRITPGFAEAQRLRSALLQDLMTGSHRIPDSYDELLERAS